MRTLETIIKQGDCLEVLRKYPNDYFDLIITSPPYADCRAKLYGGTSPDDYKPTGTFILNIKEKVVNGERHTYVIELILELRRQGWLWTEEFIWHKKNSHPGKWPNRFRDAWERCLQFNKTKRFNMYQEAVMVPMGDWAKTRLKKLGDNDVIRFNSQVGSGFGKNIANWVGRDKAYPSNVLHMATETGNRSHGATFPHDLPEWFIKLFTKTDDWILDPFLGCGTVCEVAQKLGRNSVGIDVLKEYVDLARDKVNEKQILLCEEAARYGTNNKKRNNRVHRT